MHSKSSKPRIYSFVYTLQYCKTKTYTQGYVLTRFRDAGGAAQAQEGLNGRVLQVW